MSRAMGEMLAGVSADIRDGLALLDEVEARMLDKIENVKWDVEKIREEING